MTAAGIQAKTAWLTDATGLMTRELTVVVPVKTVSESNMRGHWSQRAKRARGQRLVTGLVFGSAWKLEPMAGPWVVTMTRQAPSSGLDDDNLRGALKAVRDAVSDVLGIDDRDPSVKFAYGQRRGTYAVELKVVRAS